MYKGNRVMSILGVLVKNIKKYSITILFGLGLLSAVSVQTMLRRNLIVSSDVASGLTKQIVAGQAKARQSLSLKPVIQELGMGIQKHSLLAPDGSSMCLLSTTPGSHFCNFDSPAFNAIDISSLPAELLHIIVAVKAIKARYDLNAVVMIGDLYVPLAHRGKGYASHLLEETCMHLFSNGAKAVVLIPDPFEYENGAAKLLADDDKKQNLVKLYQRCGFKSNDDSAVVFMYRDSINT